MTRKLAVEFLFSKVDDVWLDDKVHNMVLREKYCWGVKMKIMAVEQVKRL